ncbi:MAG: hypothetical protein JO360_19235 [Acidobacteria bacterium]|nr:hypothetical protein [Acidobacteriota bacterium]
MKNKVYAIIALLLMTLLPAAATARAASDEAEVRGVVERVFQQLKSGDYNSLYDVLPSNSQQRITRQRFTSMLERTRDMYDLDRIEIGAVRTSGDIATVDTVMYGRVRKPLDSEAKIVAQQYLVREGGRWRVATGDRATVKRFLAANPGFAKKFSISEPRAYVKRDGRWVDISALAKAAAKRKAN